MRASELREQGREELMEQLGRMRKRLFQLRTEFHTDEEPDTSEKSKLRKDIARILTILRARELESAGSAGEQNAIERETAR